MTDALIAELVASGVSANELQLALRPVLQKKAELAAIERRVAAIEAERRAATAAELSRVIEAVSFEWVAK